MVRIGLRRRVVVPGPLMRTLLHTEHDEVHVFDGTRKGDARRARDAAIQDTFEFDNNQELAVILRWGDREVWQVRRNGEWRDICVEPEASD